MTELMQELIEFLKNASPAAWQTLLKQVYVEAAGQIAWALAMAVVCALLVKLGLYAKRQYVEDAYSLWDVGKWLSFGGACIAGLVAFGLCVSAMQWLANPEFYAIRYIIQSLR
jgi:uncharacterized membrane protein